MFFQHGAQKLFGWFGGNTASLVSMMGVAGIIEVIAGIVIFLGIFVRLAALISTLEMIVALVIVHFPQGINPLQNGGEPAILYFVAFLIMLSQGAGIWSLGRAIFKEEKL